MNMMIISQVDKCLIRVLYSLPIKCLYRYEVPANMLNSFLLYFIFLDRVTESTREKERDSEGEKATLKIKEMNNNEQKIILSLLIWRDYHNGNTRTLSHMQTLLWEYIYIYIWTSSSRMNKEYCVCLLLLYCNIYT